MSVNKSGRTIQATRKVTAKTILLRWETMLVFLFLAVNAMNIAISPNYLNAYNLFTNFGLVMHRTVYGRHMFAVGTNRLAAEYAAVNVHRVRMIAYSVTGLMCGLAAVFYCSWMGSVKSNVAEGYELEAISMCVLGGVSTAGGKGTFPGVIIAIFIVGLLRYGLGLINVNTQTIRIIIGAMLILAVMLPNLGLERLFRKRAKKQDAPIEPSM